MQQIGARKTVTVTSLSLLSLNLLTLLQVVVVDHDKDSGLCYIDEVAAEAVSNAIKFGAEACVSVRLSHHHSFI